MKLDEKFIVIIVPTDKTWLRIKVIQKPYGAAFSHVKVNLNKTENT